VAGSPAANWHVHAADVERVFEQAAGGTLFIDHIAQLSAAVQARLTARLSAQSRRVNAATMPTGNGVRLIVGSNRSLRADLLVGAFSDALFYRLNVIHIDLMHQDESGEPIMKARDIMSQPPYTCGPNTDLAAVAKIMWDHDCGFVPVVDASGVVAGVVTDRDICMATATRRLLPEHISAAQAMTTPIHACMSDDNLSDVLATMKQFCIRRVPVIDVSGRLQGVISLNDLVLASTDRREPRASDVVATMAAICAHRALETAVA
jgi:CBS domain-containing protein